MSMIVLHTLTGRIAAALAFLLVACVTPAGANWLAGLLGGKPTLVCKAEDRDCLYGAAVDISVALFASDRDGFVDDHAARLGRLLAITPPDFRAGLEERYRDADADDDFIARAEELGEIAPPPEPITAAALERAIASGSSPTDELVSDYARRGLRTLLTDDPAAALALFDAQLDALWQSVYPAIGDVVQWLAENDVDALVRYAASHPLPDNAPFYEVYPSLSLAAAEQCRAGHPDAGEAILGVLERDRQSWPPERIKKAMHWASFSHGIIACRGIEAGLALIEPVKAQMAADIAAEEAKPHADGELAFILGVIRSGVSENLTEPLVWALHESGREEEARALFESDPAKAMTATVDALASEGITGASFDQVDYATFIEDGNELNAYSTDPHIVLDWFVNDWVPDFSICCIENGRPVDVLDEIAALWPSPLARQAAERALATVTQATEESSYSAASHHLDTVRWRIAALQKQSSGRCALPEATAADWVRRIREAEEDSVRADLLISAVQYFDTPAGPAGDGADCLIR